MTIALGRQSEDRALRYLQQQGLQLVTRNYACRCGEIDLVMRDAAVLVFVEVRSRRHAQFGGAAASVDRAKQQKLWRTAEHYLLSVAQHPACRFDMVAIDGAALRWLKDVMSR